MPSAEAPARVVPTLQRDGDTLHIRGDLVADSIDGLWKPALAALAGLARIDVSGVERIDSSGVALLAELSARAGGADVVGGPPNLSALRDAYRLTPALGFAA